MELQSGKGYFGLVPLIFSIVNARWLTDGAYSQLDDMMCIKLSRAESSEELN